MEWKSWMLRNVQRLRVQYHQSVQAGHTEIKRGPKGTTRKKKEKLQEMAWRWMQMVPM